MLASLRLLSSATPRATLGALRARTFSSGHVKCFSRATLASLDRPVAVPKKFTVTAVSASARWSSSAATAKPLEDSPFEASPPRPSSSEPKPETEEDDIVSDSASKTKSKDKDNRIKIQPIKRNFSYDTYRAITGKPFGYDTLSPVQAAVFNLLPELADPNAEQPDGKGRDLLVKAKTGTGKTLAYLVPALEARVLAIERTSRGVLDPVFAERTGRDKESFDPTSLDKHSRAALVREFAKSTVGTLVLSPTRELATQIANESVKLMTYHERFETRLLVGGSSKGRQMFDWNKGRRDVVVATPGRMLDLLENEPAVRDAAAGTQTLILDEADTLLEMGFRDDLKAIINFLPKKRQTFLFSATVSKEIEHIARAALSPQHRFIDMVPPNEQNVHFNIPQYHTILPNASEQIPHVFRLIAHDQLQNPGKSKVIIFCPTAKMTQMFYNVLRNTTRDLPAGRETAMYEIHSKKNQDQRFRTSNNFRQDQRGASVLVTSDVSARGVDYPGVTRVVQIGIPASRDQYIHRVGRTGRAGHDGRGDIVLLPWEAGFLTWQLQDLPIQPLPADKFKTDLNELAAKYDADRDAMIPKEVLQRMTSGARSGVNRRDAFRHGPKLGLAPIEVPILPRLNGMEEHLEGTLARILPEDVREVFASMLGFYIGRTPELRATKQVVLEGLKAWAVEAGGMEEEPYVSLEFLRKLGMDDGRTKYFGRERRTHSYNSERQGKKPWEMRGHVTSRMDRERAESGKPTRFALRGDGRGESRMDDRNDLDEGDGPYSPMRRGGSERDFGDYRDGARPRFGAYSGGRPSRRDGNGERVKEPWQLKVEKKFARKARTAEEQGHQYFGRRND